MMAPSARTQARIVAALADGPMTAQQIAARAHISPDHVYLATAHMRSTGALVIADYVRPATPPGKPRAKQVMVFGLPGRDPVCGEKNEADADAPPPPARKPSHAGSGQIAGPTYRRGFANWGGARR